jgi:deoxycytidine triphosphate deaminase
MAFLTGIEIKKRIKSGDVRVNSIDPNFPFITDILVTEDSIDLRLCPIGYRYKNDVEEIDSANPEGLFENIDIPTEGYLMERNSIIFSSTLEAIALPADLIGLVITRSTYARMGLSINCMAPKFAAGIHWAFPLQLINCNDSKGNGKMGIELR